MDVNGDGLTDIVEGDGASGWEVNINNGSSWGSPVSWLSNGPNFDHDVALADADGNSFPDIVTREGGVGWLVYRNRGDQSNLLISIHNSLGGIIDIAYEKSTTFDNSGVDDESDLGFNTYVATSITRDNGLTGSQYIIETHTYTYEGGLHDYLDKEFRGFSKVVETNAHGAKIIHQFHQSDALKGNEYQVEIYDAAENIYAKTVNTFSSVPQNDGYIVQLDRTDIYVYDGSSDTPKQSFTEYSYDTYNNVIRTFYGGEESVTGDERYEYAEYVYNPALWILNLPKHTYLRASDDSTVVRENWFYYDEHESLDTPPEQGNLTKQEDWLDTDDNPVTLLQYDSYGNVVLTTDANNHTTQYIYGLSDTTFTYPDQMINAKSQATNYVYDLGTGNLLSETDPNSFVKSYEYDVFGRIIKEIKPYDSSVYPTISYEYLTNAAAPNGVIVSQRTVSGQNTTLKNYTFVDGFGRTIQTRDPSENNGQQIVVNTYYDEIGRIDEQSVPHLYAIATEYTAPIPDIRSTKISYDPIGREVQIQNPDNTTRTVTYDHWRIDYQDENNHKTRK